MVICHYHERIDQGFCMASFNQLVSSEGLRILCWVFTALFIAFYFLSMQVGDEFGFFDVVIIVVGGVLIRIFFESLNLLLRSAKATESKKEKN